MTRAAGLRWQRVGRWSTNLQGAALIGAKLAGVGVSWSLVTFPWWGPIVFIVGGLIAWRLLLALLRAVFA